MFADLSTDSDWSGHSRRGWTTLISFAAQAVAVSCVLLLPLFYTDGLPRLTLLAPLLAPAPPSSVPQAPRPIAASASESNRMGNTLVSPPRIPFTLTVPTDTVPSIPGADSIATSVFHGGGIPSGRGTVAGSVLGSEMVLPPPPPALHHPAVSRMMEGNLVHRVQPDYPPLARQVRVQGQVVLRAMISRDGAIENLQVLSGHPMLIPAAVAAVRQWRYRPYLLDGEPVEVETQVTVNFILSGG